MSLQGHGRLLGFFFCLSLLFPFFKKFPLTVSSLNLINLSEGALGKCDMEVAAIAECAGEGVGELWRHQDTAWGRQMFLGLGCS